MVFAIMPSFLFFKLMKTIRKLFFSHDLLFYCNDFLQYKEVWNLLWISIKSFRVFSVFSKIRSILQILSYVIVIHCIWLLACYHLSLFLLLFSVKYFSDFSENKSLISYLWFLKTRHINTRFFSVFCEKNLCHQSEPPYLKKMYVNTANTLVPSKCGTHYLTSSLLSFV